MKNRIILYCFVIFLICWLLPFILRIFFVEMPTNVDQSSKSISSTQKIVNEITLSFSNNDRKAVFFMIFKNNMKGCLLNIVGGLTLGFGTLVNALINGFYSADVFATSYQHGMSIKSILETTLPHSFELIGFWLSGAIGFYIAWNIIRFMRNKAFLKHFYKQVGICSVLVFLIILSAAYVEAYISVKNI